MPDQREFSVFAFARRHDASREAAPDDFDYALGAECADPALQIERWQTECAKGPPEGERSW